MWKIKRKGRIFRKENWIWFENKLKFQQLYTAFRRASTGLQYGLTMANAGARMGSQALSHQWLTWWQWLNVWLTTKWWLKSTSWTRHVTQRGASWGTCMDATNRPNKVSFSLCFLCFLCCKQKKRKKKRKTLNH